MRRWVTGNINEVAELGRTKKGKKAADILNLMKECWMNVGNRSNLIFN